VKPGVGKRKQTKRITINKQKKSEKMKIMKRKLKMMALMAAMAAGVLLPCTMKAQDLFSGNPINNQRFGVSNEGGIDNQMFGVGNVGSIDNQRFGASNEGNITNQTFGNKLPLGSGILIMVAAGAGYAALKRKRVKSS